MTPLKVLLREERDEFMKRKEEERFEMRLLTYQQGMSHRAL